MPQQTSILILGAGELGSQILHHLLTHPALNPTTTNTKISLLLRPSTISTTNPAKKSFLQTYTSNNITLLPCDITATPEPHLSTLFAPFTTIISSTGMTLPPGTQLKLTRAILAAGVQHYIPWQFGLDYDAIGRGSGQDLFDEQLDVREVLRAQERTKWTIVSTGVFVSFLFGREFGVVRLGDEPGVVALGSWERELAVTDVGDIGRVVAELVFGDDVGEGKRESGVIFVAGDTVGMRRLADVVEGLVGREVERRVKSVEELEAELRAEPGDAMRKYRVVFARGVGVSWDREGSFNVRKGIETVSLEDWVRENAGVLLAG